MLFIFFCLFFFISGKSQTQQKLNPHEKLPIYDIRAFHQQVTSGCFSLQSINFIEYASFCIEFIILAFLIGRWWNNTRRSGNSHYDSWLRREAEEYYWYDTRHLLCRYYFLVCNDGRVIQKICLLLEQMIYCTSFLPYPSIVNFILYLPNCKAIAAYGLITSGCQHFS